MRSPGATVAALLGALAAFGPAWADPLPARPVLSVAVEAGSTPAAGFARDLFGEVAREMDAGLLWAEVPRDAALAGLDAGRYDVAAGPFSKAEAAGRRWLFPVARAGDGLLKRRGDGAILVPRDVAGKTVGIAGAPADVARLAARTAALQARPAKRPAWRARAMPADLAAGRLAALAGPLDLLAALALAQPELFELVGPPLGPTTALAPAMSPDAGAAPLAQAASVALARMAADGRLAALQRRWLGLAFDAPDASPAHPPPVP